MITEELKKKIDRAIKLLKSFDNPNEPVEVAYSGGKDSDVILQLVKESGINYRAIYKNTTIDPAGTIKHVLDNNVEILRPKESFFQLIARKGYPSRIHRFCCEKLKEYKVLDKCVLGVRQSESKKREERYKEPTQCRYYNGRTEKSADAEEYHVEAIYPIHNWTDDDIINYIKDRGIVLHPLYYNTDGTINIKKRLGCIGCPMQSRRKRLKEFKDNPRMLRAWLYFGQKYLDTHPNVKAHEHWSNAYEFLHFTLFYDSLEKWNESNVSLFGARDSREFLEEYFNIELAITK